MSKTFSDLWREVAEQTVRKIDKRVLRAGFRPTDAMWEDFRRSAFREVIKMLEHCAEEPAGFQSGDSIDPPYPPGWVAPVPMLLVASQTPPMAVGQNPFNHPWLAPPAPLNLPWVPPPTPNKEPK